MTLLPLLLLACAPSLRIPPPVVPPPLRSEVPEAARAAYLHAAVLREQGELEQAQIALARARTLDPDSPWLTLEAARLQLARGDLEAADRALASLIPGPAETDALALRAVVARLRGDVVRSEVLVTEAMTRDPSREALWMDRMALLLGSAGREAEARSLALAWAKGPARSVDALLARAQSRMMAGDAAGALDDLGAALALGDRERAPGLLVEAARASGRLGSALGWLARAEPQDLGLLQTTLLLARAAGDGLLEVETLRAMLAMDPADGAHWATLSALLAVQGDARGAKTAAAKARALGVKVAPAVSRGAPDASALVGEGRALLASGQPEQALALALQAIDRAPASAEGWRLLAQGLTAQQRFADAALAEGRAARYAGAGSGVE